MGIIIVRYSTMIIMWGKAFRSVIIAH